MGVKVGDVVRIKPYEEARYTDLWVREMNEYAGKLLVVSEIGDDGFNAENIEWWFSYGAIEKIINRKEEE